MAVAAKPSVRMTLRCMREDLAVEIPPPSLSLEALVHPLMRKANDLAVDYPENQIRIQEIDDTLVYRFTHGRLRVLTWRDASGIIWLCGAAIRRQDAGYDQFIALHRRGELLASAEDERRLDDERLLAFANEIRRSVPTWLAEARTRTNEECRFQLPGGIEILLFVEPGETEAIWLALPTLLAEELGLHEAFRALIIATITAELGGAMTDYESRSDWPTGRSLRNYEMAYFWLR
jgi:hypothetical protein